MKNELSNALPKNITATDLNIDTSNFSQKWKDTLTNLAENIFDEYEKNEKNRYIVAIGGGSGSSKTVSTIALGHIMNAVQNEVEVVVVGQDGYHYQHDYLEKTQDKEGLLLAEHKGRFDTFDIEALNKDLENFVNNDKVSFPRYSRKIHNPIPNDILCDSPKTIILLEGLWLLYNKKPWKRLVEHYDMTILFETSSETRRHNTITRHVMGNEHSPENAELFYDNSDSKNGEELLNNLIDVDLKLNLFSK